mgnify:CR=1 FL=1
MTASAVVAVRPVVTDAFKGEDLNGYLPIFKEYEIPAPRAV